MKLPALIVVLAASLAPAIAAAACDYHDTARMSCAEGLVYDDTTGSCVPATTG